MKSQLSDKVRNIFSNCKKLHCCTVHWQMVVSEYVWCDTILMFSDEPQMRYLIDQCFTCTQRFHSQDDIQDYGWRKLDRAQKEIHYHMQLADSLRQMRFKCAWRHSSMAQCDMCLNQHHPLKKEILSYNTIRKSLLKLKKIVTFGGFLTLCYVCLVKHVLVDCMHITINLHTQLWCEHNYHDCFTGCIKIPG